jgi:hypothetical protein
VKAAVGHRLVADSPFSKRFVDATLASGSHDHLSPDLPWCERVVGVVK